MRYDISALRKVGIIVLMILFVAIGCDEQKTSENNPTGPTSPNLPADPGSGNLAGKIVGTINGQPISGVTVSVRGKTTSTGPDGTFLLNGVGEGSFGVVISGNSIYTRTAAVNTTQDGRSVELDAIEQNSAFNLGFYRELARGNHPNEGDLFPTHRWINSTPPTFYIDTDASATLDRVIDQEQINTVRQVITQIVPVFTGNVYPSVPIKTRAFNRLDFDLDIPNNSFVISFDDSLIWWLNAFGLTQTDPDFTDPTTSAINKAIVLLVDQSSFYTRGGITLDEVTAHETGHGFGFRHTSLLPSVMVAIGAYGGLFSDADRLHMAIIYKRPAGNTDIDNDPIPGAKMAGQPLGRQIFIDRRANFPKSPELIRQLQALPSKIPAEQRRKIQNFRDNQ
jgi:hypothetical protein